VAKRDTEKERISNLKSCDWP